MKKQNEKRTDLTPACFYNEKNGFKEGEGFGKRERPEGSLKEGYHYGIDFRAANGTPIPAVLDGTVVFNAFNKGKKGEKGYGNIVILKHILYEDCVIYTLYAHLMEKSQLSPHSKVKSGDIIGIVGDGHLHFEVILRSGLEKDLSQDESGATGVENKEGRVDPKEAACKLKTLKTLDFIWTLELCGIDTGEKCMGDHKNPWAVGCVYGVTLGQMAGGFSRAVAAGDWSLDPCAVFCGI